MKRLFFRWTMTAVIAMAVTWAGRADDGRDGILKIYNWADYIDEALLSEFEVWYHEQTGESVHVIYETFDVNENMLAEIEVGHEDYDAVCPSEYIIERMLRHDLLQPIQKDFGTTPNYLDNVSPFAVEKFQQMGGPGVTVGDYAVGYMWGTTGILFNTALVDRSVLHTWAALLRPEFEQRILMKDAFRDIYSAIICYARRDDVAAGRVTRDELVGHVTDEYIADVEAFLVKAKPNIAGWEVDFGKETMTKGKAWMNVSWSGDAMWAIQEAAEVGVELDYIVPDEGSNVWFDGWVIPKYARNPRAASYFINYMCKPENAVRNMEAIGYVSVIATQEVMEAMIDTTIAEAYDLSYFFGDSIGADSLHVNPIMYPDRLTIERCALMHDCADKTEAMLEMWARVKGDNLRLPMVVIIVIIATCVAVFFISRRRKRHSRRRRK